MKNENGITLISLVMTIVLIVILAAISTYTGIEAYNNMRVQAFVAKMIALQEKVDIFCDKYSVSEINSMGVKFENCSDTVATQVLNDVITMGQAGNLKCWFSTDAGTSNYRYFTISDIETKFELKDFDVAIWLNPTTRNVIAVEGVTVDDIEYYRQYDLAGGQTLAEPIVDTNYTLTDYTLYTYDNKAVVKFSKQYATVSYTINDSSTKTFSHVSEIELPYSGKYKIEVVDVSGVPKSADNIMVTIVNKPMLVDGMKAVKLNSAGTGWVETTQNDPEWYNYDSSVKKWANVKLKDGSMFVWIPRFAYKINADKSIDVVFLKDTSNIYEENGVEKECLRKSKRDRKRKSRLEHLSRTRKERERRPASSAR